MAQYVRLHEYVGQIINVVSPDASTSDGIAASDNDNGVGIQGFNNVLFILSVGDMVASATLTPQIQYSSTGSASDAVTSNAGMSCTDAVWTAVDSDGENEVYLLDFNVPAHSLSDAAGKLYVSFPAGDDTSKVEAAVIAIPYNGTVSLPVSQENTVVVAAG